MCSLVPRLATATRVVLVMHHGEVHRPSNTGRLALASLVNSELVVHGGRGEAPPGQLWRDDTEPLLLFPRAGAIPIERWRAEHPGAATLIVPDGTWSQANRMQKRLACLRDVPAVSLTDGAPSIYRLRASAGEHRVCTIEAIARALGVLEDLETQTELERLCRVMVERTLKMRGRVAANDPTACCAPSEHSPRPPAALPEAAR
jgi:DTW domain-containing protein